MQIIYRARDITEAHIVAGLLRSNGVVGPNAGRQIPQNILAARQLEGTAGSLKRSIQM